MKKKIFFLVAVVALLVTTTLVNGQDSILYLGRLVVQPSVDYGESTSNGGAMLLKNTGNNGAGLVIYTNNGESADGRLLNIRSDNMLFHQSAFHVDYKGDANAVEIVANQNDSSAQALNIVSTNVLDTTVGIQGEARTRGVVKLTHVKDGNDSNSSALSIMLDGTGSYCHGIYANTGADYLGYLIYMRSNSEEKFSVDNYGNVTMGMILHLTPVNGTPAILHEGDIYYNNVTNKAYCYDGTSSHALW